MQSVLHQVCHAADDRHGLSRHIANDNGEARGSSRVGGSFGSVVLPRRKESTQRLRAKGLGASHPPTSLSASRAR